jgi:SAM-dependent methyltransferase
MTALLRSIYQRIFPTWTNCLKKELSDCDTVLDLGCGYDSPIQHCKVTFSVGVELFEPYLQESKRKAIHNQYIKADIRKIEFKPKSFDAAIAVELLEHLTKEEGYMLINKMEKWAKKKVVITTPNGYLWQDGYDNNPLQEHKSGWSVKELRKLGFKVSGISGWKKLRRYKGDIKYAPHFLWDRLSDLSQKITYYYPKLAFQLFAIKQIAGGK